MNTLDFGEIMERDCWWEDYDEFLRCPFCQEGVKTFDVLSKKQQDHVAEKFCAANHWAPEEDESPTDWMDLAIQYTGDESEIEEWYEQNLDDFRNEDVDGEEFNCDECGGEADGTMFEIMWNTAFSVDCDANDLEKRRTAWGLGFCLIDHNGSSYLLMGSCGQDNTWLIHYTRWLLQGKELDLDDSQSCLGNWSAHVFLHGEPKKEFLKYLVEHVVDIDSAVRRVSYGVEDAMRVLEYPTPYGKTLAGLPEKRFRVPIARVTKLSLEVLARSLHEAAEKAGMGAYVVGVPEAVEQQQKEGGNGKED